MALGHDSADIRLWQETGLFWPKVDYMDNWKQRLKGKGHGIASQLSYNTLEQDITGVHQPGGTAIISNIRMTSKKLGQGMDSSGLGRWAWMTFGDEERQQTTFFSAYRPCHSTSGGGTATYDQHRRHLQPTQEPREQFLLDLATDINIFQDKGHNIIVGMDVNENIYGTRINNFMDNLNLHDALAVLHGKNVYPQLLKVLVPNPLI